MTDCASCPQIWTKGCMCEDKMRELAEFRRDRVHEMAVRVWGGVGCE